MSEQPDAAKAAPTATAPRSLRRRATDKVIGGVAAGIADYLNIDPILVRAGFVGLMIFGGAGLVLYVGAWLLIPVEGRDDSLVEAGLQRIGISPSQLAAIALVIVGGAIFLSIPMTGISGPVGEPVALFDARVLIVFVLVILGIVLLRRGGPQAVVTVADPAPVAAAQRTATTAAPVIERRPAAPRSPLAWYVIAAVLCAIGVLALIDQTSGLTAMPGQFLGLVLAVVGIGLFIGSWWGHARVLILPALLVLPVAVAASFVTAPLDGGVGEQRFVPTVASELRGEYRLTGGQLTLDLRDLETAGEAVAIQASVAFGELVVILPPQARLEIDARVGAGGTLIMDSWQAGTDLTDRYVRGTDGPQFVLDLEAGIGQITVYARPGGG